MNTGTMSTIERAIQLARSGECRSIEEIRTTLRLERFEGVQDHTAGLGTKRKLKALIEEARRAAEKRSDKDV